MANNLNPVNSIVSSAGKYKLPSPAMPPPTRLKLLTVWAQHVEEDEDEPENVHKFYRVNVNTDPKDDCLLEISDSRGNLVLYKDKRGRVIRFTKPQQLADFELAAKGNKDTFAHFYELQRKQRAEK